ncbi:hypothetical protein [Cohnella abietis]|uniref:Uncharacterized protein n=1 Tax=Cohnella abietis TaxID=2507935 RepID=A0A3T1CZF3_9BACL|nr:hypothetical protein [Cohnella abietis]BBI31149.1 hypothetical protein KCTCHS21_05480 [Cohnella abietis]
MATIEASNKLDRFTSQLSAHIWGHRFKEGQRGPEYVLEFLNVLFGASYSLSHEYYHRKRSVGLRKFIFEGVKEGSGSNDILVLKEEEKQKLVQAVQENNVHVLKQFLKNLEVVLYNTTGKEADRSWFARSLYPLHESLLYVELRKKGKDLSFERNFFARGGELYFLMLGHGTDKHINRRKFIENRFQQLLTKNKIIEKVVDKISSAFEEKEPYQDRTCKLRSSSQDENVPALPPSAPQDNEQLFEGFADELERLLLIDLDIYEMFHLLTSLICFQLARYMHERALIVPSQFTYFFDCLDGINKPITQQAASSFEQHENLIKQKFEHEFEQKVQESLGSSDHIEQQLPLWKADPEIFFEKMGLSQLRSRKGIIETMLLRCNNADDVSGKLKDIVREAVSDQLKKNQLNITRVLSRDGGFATYRRGSASNYRYTISDSFLQMLVFTKVKPKEKMEYNEFLDVLFREYGIVIGVSQAKESGLYEQSRLNVRYFQDNEKALRDKLRHNGLLIEFSDATAMIQNPYASTAEVSYA